MTTEILNALEEIEKARAIVLTRLNNTLSIQEKMILENILVNLEEQQKILITSPLEDNIDNIHTSNATLQDLGHQLNNSSRDLLSVSNAVKKVSNVLSALTETVFFTKAKPPQAKIFPGEGPSYKPPPAPPSRVASPPPAPAPVAVVKPSRGKILYDIPDNMVVFSQQKCVIRIGENEEIVKDSDTFSGAEKIEDVPISKVMNVELIDIADPPHFAIKTITSTEQEIESDSYTEWLFWITPLIEGNFSILLKVSIIKMIDGKERKKELVFEKPVNITAQPATPPKAVTSTPTKDLLDEKNVTEMDPPNVFISYAHKDKDYFDIFLDNLAAQSGWNIWTDKNIEIGTSWYDSIQERIKDADMGVLLVSAFFISSGFIKENEYKKFNELKESKPGFIFLPVLLRDVDINRWQSLSQMQFFSADGDDYGFPDYKGKILPFAALCIFNEKGELNENYRRDTYFKNFVTKVNTEWLKTKKLQPA